MRRTTLSTDEMPYAVTIGIGKTQPHPITNKKPIVCINSTRQNRQALLPLRHLKTVTT